MKKLFLSLFILLILFGCKDSTSNSSNYNKVEGFAVIDEQGSIIAEVGDLGEEKAIDDQIIEISIAAYPTPFNEISSISFNVPKTGNVHLWIENAYPTDQLNKLLGNKINSEKKEKKVLLDLINEDTNAGRHSLLFRREEYSDTIENRHFYRVFVQNNGETDFFDILILEEMIPELQEIIDEQ